LLAGGAQLIEMLSSHVLAKGFSCFGSLTLGRVYSGLRHFDIDDLGFGEPTAFESVHALQPLITLKAIGRLFVWNKRNGMLSKKPRRISPSGLRYI
jgi:hypothetical protein